MTTEQAVAAFDSAVRARGLAVSFSEAGGPVLRKTESERGGAIRLTWDEGAGALFLEVTHGPPDEPPAGWLDLYQATVSEGELVPDQSDFGFEEALSHGLSLLAPTVSPAP